MKKMINLPAANRASLLEMFGTGGKDRVAAKINSLAQMIGEQKFCQEAARQ